MLQRISDAIAPIVGNITLYKKMESSEIKYRTIVENAYDFIWVLDKDGNFTCINKVAEESGYTVDELFEKTFVPLIVPEDLPRIQNIFMDTMSGTTQNYDVRIYKKNGEIMYLSVNTTPIHENGDVVGTISFGRDVTNERAMKLELQQRNCELGILNEVALAVSKSLKMSGVLNIALEKVIKLMDLDRGFILSHDDSGCMDIAAHFGIPEICMDKSTHFPRNKCICNYVKETGKIVFANGEYVCSLKDIIIPDGLHNFVCVPLTSRNKLLGVMNLIYRLDRTFSMSEIDMLESLGNTIGTAIENSTMHADSEIMVDVFEEKVRERTRVLEATFNISKVINSELKLESLLARVVGEVVAATNADSCAIAIIDYEEMVEKLFRFKANTGSCDCFEIELSKDDLPGLVDTKCDDIAGENNKDDFLNIPIKKGHKVLGTLSMYKSVISFEDRALFHNVADQLVFTIENAQLYENVIKHATDLKKLNKFMVNRELKMIKLKNNISQLEAKLAGMPTGN